MSREINKEAKVGCLHSRRNSFFHLFSDIDNLTLDYSMLNVTQEVTPSFIPSKKLRSRRVSLPYVWSPFGAWGFRERDKFALLWRILRCETVEYLDDSTGGHIAGVEDDIVWPRLKELRLGSKYHTALEQHLYPSLTTLHLGEVCIGYHPGDEIDSSRWCVVGNTLRNASPSLEEFSVELRLVNWARTKTDRYSLALHEFLIPTLKAMDWSLVAFAINAHPLLRKGTFIILLMPGLCRESNAEVEATLNNVILPIHFPRSPAQEFLRFNVQFEKNLYAFS